MSRPDALREAADWLTLLGSGEMTARQRQDYAHWRRQHPREAAAIERLGGQLQGLREQGLGSLPSEQLTRIVNTPLTRRRLMRSAGAGAGLGLLAWLLGADALRGLQPGEHWATGTAERRQWRLADGSELTLDACSRASAPQARHLRLQQGRAGLRIAAGSAFRIDTAHGSLLGNQGRLILRHTPQASQVSVLEGHLDLLGAAQVQRLDAGQRARFDANGLLDVETGAGADDAWTHGLLRIENQPLSEVISVLQTYRHGIIQLDERLTARRVSGVYPLDDSDRSLALLSDSLGLRLHTFSRYWVRIEPA